MAATIGKVSAVFSASTGGLRSGVNDAIRSFRQMGGEANSLRGVFDKLQTVASQGVGSAGPAAERASESLGRFQRLASLAQQALAAGRITAEQFAEKMNAIGRAAESMADSVSRGAALTSKYATQEENAARAIAEANDLLAVGAISAETHARAMRDLTGAAAAEAAQIDAAAKRMDEFTAVLQRGTAVTNSVKTADERYADQVQELESLLAQGAISQQTFNRAVDRASKEMQDAARSANKIGNETKSAGNGVDRLAGKLNTLIAINAAQLFGQVASAVSSAVRSFYSFAAAQAETIDRQRDLAARLGFTYGEFGGVALAATQAGVSMESVAKAITRADVAFVKAAQGSKVANQAFKNIGVSVDELQGKTPAERFRAIADAIAKLPTAAERSRAAIGLFGKSGAELLPIFEQGAGAIGEATKQADRFGLALTNAQADSVNEMKDSFTRSYEAIRGVVGQVVAYLSPALKAVSEQFQSLIGGIGGANIGEFIGEGILKGAEFFATIADAFIAQVPAVWQYVASVGEYWSGVLDFAGRVGQFFYGAFKVFETVGNVIGGLFSDIVSGLYQAAANIASVVPGFGEFSKQLTQSANSWAGQADVFAASMNKNVDEAANAFSKAFGESTKEAAKAAPGPIAIGLKDAIAKARADAASSDVAKPQTVDTVAKAVASNQSTEALKAVDSRSKEGVAEMFRLMRGGSQDVQEQQLGVLEQIRDAVSEADDVEEVFGFAGT